jgi:hypothetical protein
MKQKKKQNLKLTKESNMFIMLIKNNYNQYEVIKNHLGQIRKFDEALDVVKYSMVKDIDLYQIIEIEI